LNGPDGSTFDDHCNVSFTQLCTVGKGCTNAGESETRVLLKVKREVTGVTDATREVAANVALEASGSRRVAAQFF
jgi:hypothetical protein